MTSQPTSSALKRLSMFKVAANPESRWGLALRFMALTLILVSVSEAFIGCARFHSRPISASANADALQSRSLTNAELKLILEKNLHREFDNWPPVKWDF